MTGDVDKRRVTWVANVVCFLLICACNICLLVSSPNIKFFLMSHRFLKLSIVQLRTLAYSDWLLDMCGRYDTEEVTAVSGTLPVALILHTVLSQHKCRRYHRTNSFLCILYAVRSVALDRVSFQIKTRAGIQLYWSVLRLSLVWHL